MVKRLFMKSISKTTGQARATFLAELVDLKSNSRVGYVPSKLAMQIADDEWTASRQIIPIVTEVTVLANDAQRALMVLQMWLLLTGIQ